MMTDKAKSTRKFSPFLLMIILVALILSVVALYIALDTFFNQSEAYDTYSFLAIGFGGLALTVYMLLQARGKTSHLVFEVPRVVTTLECPKCDFKNIRDFKRDDYIFKKTDSCQKCNETMTITAIYREDIKKK
jgi:hypothetical protein